MSDLLQRGAESLGVELTPQQLQQLTAYRQLLEEEGDRLGLTSLRAEEDLVRELILDPLTGLSFFAQGARVIDVGSGGGCPGVALAVARPDLSLTLVESKQRKAGFLRRVGAELGLNLRVVAERCEDLAREADHRACFGHATAKALAALPVLLELTLPFVEVGGSLIAYKGPSLPAELEASQSALRTLGGEVETLRPYELGEKRYQLCVVRKSRPTPADYPRRAGTPARSPL